MRDLFSKTLKRIKALSSSEAAEAPLDPHIVPRDQHSVSRKHISDAAIKVMRTLHGAGFQGFLVGGGVRDLLLGGRPKDFDVATDATPEQVRQLFRSSRIIGRRFKIVHVRFGREVIEVTTFRGSHKEAEELQSRRRPTNQQSARSEEGMLLRDNVYGSLEEDAIRRDFTINALYYTTEDFAVYDYTGGLQDLHDRVIRVIGDPETRYREDPVRMLRAVRFAAKLGFTIEPGSAQPIRELADSLSSVPAARMFDEVLKLFMAGHGVATFELLREYDLFRPLFPQTDACLQDAFNLKLVLQALRNTDERIRANKPVTPAFIFAALLWPPMQRHKAELMAEGMPEVPALHQAGQVVTTVQQSQTSIPKRFSMPMREIWDLQLRLTRRSGRRAEQLLENRRFRAAYDFLLLREAAGEETDGLGQWWTDYQQQNPTQRQEMSRAVQDKQRRRRRPRKRTGNKQIAP